MIALTPRQYAEQLYNPATFATKEKLVGAIQMIRENTPHRDIVQAVDEVWADRNPQQTTTAEWETPSHEEINLAVVNPEDLGLDPFDTDNSLVRAIVKAQSDPLTLVPAELKAKPNWVRWKLETVNGRLTKIPYQLNGKKASSTDTATWNTYEAITNGASVSEGQGMGIMTDGSFVGFDLDGCRNPTTGEITEWAKRIIGLLGTYTEITPSGYGVRVYAIGQLPDGARRFSVAMPAGFGEKVGIECYADKRYFTVTGDRVGDRSGLQSSNIAQAHRLCADISREFPSEKRSDAASFQSSDSDSSVKFVRTSALPITSKLAVLMYGKIANNRPFEIQDEHGNKVTAPSQSEADMSLATLLAMKHGDNRELIDQDFRESSLYREKWDRLADHTIKKAIDTAKKFAEKTPTSVVLTPAGTEPTEQQMKESGEHRLEDPIPAFDPSVVNGIYKKFVDVATRGTTLAPQFIYAIAKTIVGAKMAGKVQFENLDVEPRFYTALIGETGSGKGEAWRRVFQILNVEHQIGNVAGLKVINSADSGAGIRDTFFEPPDSLPVLCYIDEVESFGNKASATRNPAILDQLIELADNTSISRVVAKSRTGRSSAPAKTKNDARFCAVMCGQDGHVYMKAFAGRTKLGLWDRLYPEYGVPVEAGDLPPISVSDAFGLLAELNKLDYSGMMTMSVEAKTRLDGFWAGQKPEVRKKARWKKNLTLDVYMSAFGRGSKVAELEDVEIAIKIFTRQLVIRETHFTTEVPDRTGYYFGLLKNITAKMERQLKAGVAPGLVAKSRRDYERETNAYRDNEVHIFERAWNSFAPTWLTKVEVKKANGQTYVKYLPMSEDE